MFLAAAVRSELLEPYLWHTECFSPPTLLHPFTSSPQAPLHRCSGGITADRCTSPSRHILSPTHIDPAIFVGHCLQGRVEVRFELLPQFVGGERCSQNGHCHCRPEPVVLFVYSIFQLHEPPLPIKLLLTQFKIKLMQH